MLAELFNPWMTKWVTHSHTGTPKKEKTPKTYTSFLENFLREKTADSFAYRIDD